MFLRHLIHRKLAGGRHDEQRCLCSLVEETIASLGQTQIAAGFALLTCVFCTYQLPWNDRHAWLAADLSAVCVFSTIATHALFATSDSWRPRRLRLRGSIIFLYPITLSGSALWHTQSTIDDTAPIPEYRNAAYSRGLIPGSSSLFFHLLPIAIDDSHKDDFRDYVAATALIGLTAAVQAWLYRSFNNVSWRD